MTSEEFLSKIDSLYGKQLSYQVLCSAHKELITTIDSLLIDVSDSIPEDGTWVFAVQDLSSLGKGTFLGEYFYTSEFGFNTDEIADEGYGFITRWVSFETINNNPLE